MDRNLIGLGLLSKRTDRDAGLNPICSGVGMRNRCTGLEWVPLPWREKMDVAPGGVADRCSLRGPHSRFHKVRKTHFAAYRDIAAIFSVYWSFIKRDNVLMTTSLTTDRTIFSMNFIPSSSIHSADHSVDLLRHIQAHLFNSSELSCRRFVPSTAISTSSFCWSWSASDMLAFDA